MPHVRIWPGGDGQPSSLPGPFLGICARPDHDIADDHLDNRADPDH